MKTPLEPRLKWRLKSDEILLREEAVNADALEKGEGDSPVNRIGWAVAAFLLAMWALARRGPEMWAGQWQAEQLIALGVALLLLVLASWLLFRPSKSSPWADMHAYAFTDQRISLLDAQGRVMDEIARDEITEAQITPLTAGEKSVDCFRPDDPDLERMFSILYIEDPDAVFDLIKTRYLTSRSAT